MCKARPTTTFLFSRKSFSADGMSKSRRNASSCAGLQGHRHKTAVRKETVTAYLIQFHFIDMILLLVIETVAMQKSDDKIINTHTVLYSNEVEILRYYTTLCVVRSAYSVSTIPLNL